MNRHTLLYCVSLYCPLQILRFSKLKVCGNSASSKSIGAIFPTAFAAFVSLCHILVILAKFQTLSLWVYLLWWSVISDLWHYYCNCLGQMVNLIDKCGVFWPPHPLGVPPSLPLSLGLLTPWDTTILKLDQLVTLQWPLGIPVKGRITRLFKSKARNEGLPWWCSG